MTDLLGIALEWLFGSIDPTRFHDISSAQSWHGRLMLVAWGICIPIGIVTARYLKVMPNQNWPEELDNKFWWYAHLCFQIGGALVMLIALAIILSSDRTLGSHGILGWTIIALCFAQVASGLLRGSKGGPTELERRGTLRGDHYDMTRKRKVFAAFHKSVGYLLLIGGAFGVLHGLWTANAPRWMFLSITIFWGIMGGVSMILSRRQIVTSTYQAIWGPDPNLPGNRKT